MPACEKCWSDSFLQARLTGLDQVDAYRALVAERICTPAEQCGEMHLVVEWTDSEPMCRCKHAKQRPAAREHRRKDK